MKSILTVIKGSIGITLMPMVIVSLLSVSCTTFRSSSRSIQPPVDSLSAEIFNSIFQNGTGWFMDKSYFVYENDSIGSLDNTEYEGGQTGIILLWRNDSLCSYFCYDKRIRDPNTYRILRLEETRLYDTGTYTYDEATHVLTINDIVFQHCWKHIHEFTILSVSKDEIRCYSDYWPTQLYPKDGHPVKSLNIFTRIGEKTANN